MTKKDKSSGMKSAYELALERLEAEGIEPPREGGLAEEVKQQIAEERRKAEAKVAELEILHGDKMAGLADPVQRQQEAEDHRLEKLRIGEQRDRKIEALRKASD